MSHVRVHLNLASELPSVPADPHQLQQVFLNLTNNAVDAILELGTEGDLWVRTWADGGKAFVEFRDSGPGVKDTSRVFDPFYTTKPVGKGTGLGLSICYGIITEHGGSIEVRNAPERGAIFRVELPLRSDVRGPKSLGVEAQRTVKSGRILVVDANESVLETMAELLSGNEHLVTISKSLEEARRLVGAKEFDLVVADWQMVYEEESQHVDADRLNPEHGLGPQVLWTTSVSAMEKGAARFLPADAAILQKPFQAEELYAAVESKLFRVAAPIFQE
jgi:two-component system NtrC family sensor kinase